MAFHARQVVASSITCFPFEIILGVILLLRVRMIYLIKIEYFNIFFATNMRTKMLSRIIHVLVRIKSIKSTPIMHIILVATTLIYYTNEDSIGIG